MNDDRQERISRRAHELWQAEGGVHGRHEAHWAQAERDIDAENRPSGIETPLASAAGALREADAVRVPPVAELSETGANTSRRGNR